MIVRVIDMSSDIKNVDYIISVPIGKTIIKHFGNQVDDPIEKMGKLLYSHYMSFCVPVIANQDALDVINPDIIFFVSENYGG